LNFFFFLFASFLFFSCVAGDVALLVFPPGIEFVSAFWGCIYAGVLAAPVYPPHPAYLMEDLPKFHKVHRGSGATVLLTTSQYQNAIAVMSLKNSLKKKTEGSFPFVSFVFFGLFVLSFFSFKTLNENSTFLFLLRTKMAEEFKVDHN
jgi:acyl-CoA synthetase (AMP-forming)/AMP-acid ligase II